VGKTSVIATLAGLVGGAALLLAAGGPLGILLGMLRPMSGFQAFMLGCLLGVAGLALGALGLFLTRPSAGRGGRGRALLGVLVGLALVGVVARAAGPSRGLPPVNDITTNPDDPPKFHAPATLEANEGRDMSYAGGELARVTREAYPDLVPIQVKASPAKTFGAAKRAAVKLGWKLVKKHRAAGVIEANSTSRVFRFVDDVVIRIRATDEGSVVDVRSKSRDGRGDLGANAARIRAFREALLASV
jgi:uncharacterized protein (DUF1499 family)